MDLRDIWLSTEETAQLLGCSDRHLRRNRHLYVHEEIKGRHAKVAVRFLLSSLPREAQARYAACEAAELSGGNLAEYNPADLSRAIQRYNAVKATRAASGPASRIADMVGCSQATIYRWKSQFDKWGFDALLPKKRERAGAGSRAATPEMERYIRQLYLNPRKPTAAWVAKQAVKKAAELGCQPPSRATVYRIIDQIPETEKVMAREGLQAWRRDVMPKIRRRTDDLPANGIWVGDHHQCDFWVLDGGRPVRPWITAWFDVATRIPVGYCFTASPSSESIALAFRHGVLPKADPDFPFCGVPQGVYIDNGKDYRSRLLSGGLKTNRVDFSTETLGVFASLNVQVTYAQPYTPWAKHVERWFGTLADQWSRFQPGWTGRNPKDRPARAHENVKRLAKAGGLHKLQDLPSVFEPWLKEYLNTVHSELGVTPLDAWKNAMIARPAVPDDRALDVLLMKSEGARVYDDGIRRFKETFWHDALAPLVGEHVTIRFDSNRIGELLVFHQGKYVCTATNRYLLSFHASEEMVKEHVRRQRAERKRVTESLRAIHRSQDELEAIAAEARSRGPRSVTREPGQRGSDNVRMLTRFDQAAKEIAAASSRNVSRKDIPDASGDREVSIADEWIKEAGRRVLAARR